MAELFIQHMDDVTIVRFNSQKILSDVLIANIGRELMDVVGEADGKMLLNFQGVSFMSSSMIGKIVRLNNKCKEKKITVKLCTIHPSILEVFEITRLTKIFSIYSTEDEALKAFAKKGWFGR